jgi:hypothetical protein
LIGGKMKFERMFHQGKHKLLLLILMIFVSYVEYYITYFTENRIHFLFVKIFPASEFVDVGFKIFQPLHNFVKPDSMYPLRFFIFGLQSFIMISLVLYLGFKVVYYQRIQLGYSIVTMYLLRVMSMHLFVLPNQKGKLKNFKKDLIWHFPGIPETRYKESKI